MNDLTTQKPKFSKFARNYAIIATCVILFFIVFIANLEWETRINGLFLMLFLMVVVPIGGYLIYFLKKLNTYTMATDSKKINQYPKFYVITISSILCLITIIASVVGIYYAFENKAKAQIVDQISENAAELKLENVEVLITSKNIEYGYYNVIIRCSNLNDFQYSEIYRIDKKIGCSDAFITSYKSGDDTYEVFTSSVYKNGKRVYEYTSSSITSADAPYVGMDASSIGKTKLGSPDKTELCRDYHALKPERRSVTYKWYDSNGKMIYYAFAINGKVTSVTDYRK